MLGSLDLKPALKKLLRPLHNGVRVQLRAEFQLVQKLFIIGAEPWLLPQCAHEMAGGHAVVEMKIIQRPPAVFLQKPSGIILPQRRQDRPLRQLLSVNGVFQTQPEQTFIFVPILVLLEGGEDRFNFRILVMSAHRADDAVPVHIRISLRVIGLEIGDEGIVSRGVPDQVHRAPALQLGNAVHDFVKSSAAVSSLLTRVWIKSATN